MAAYLSAAWFEDVNRVARADGELARTTAGARVTIQQIVWAGPTGDTRYWVQIDDGVVEVGSGEAPGADATVAQSFETAVAVSRGDLPVEQALAEGRIRLSGDVSVLLRHAAALGGVAAAFGEVRTRTTYG